MLRSVSHFLLLLVVCLLEKGAFLGAAQELTLDEATAQAVNWFNEADIVSEGTASSVARDLRTRALDLLGQVSLASGGKHAAAAFLLGMMRQVPAVTKTQPLIHYLNCYNHIKREIVQCKVFFLYRGLVHCGIYSYYQ